MEQFATAVCLTYEKNNIYSGGSSMDKQIEESEPKKQEEEWLDMPKAIEWLEKGMLYCESYSAYELALIYLYNDEYKNVERGLMCLNRCVEDNYIQGIEGLANVYFNGELVEEDMRSEEHTSELQSLV